MHRLALIGLLLVAIPPAGRAAAPASAVTAGSPRVHDGAEAPWTLCFEDRDILPWRTRTGTGRNIDLLEAASRQTGLRFRYVALPWRRCQSEVASGAIDGLFAISHSAEREWLWVYPRGEPDRTTFRMFQDGYVLVHRAGDTVAVVEGRVVGVKGRIGAQPGYSVVADLLRQGVEVDEGSPEPARIVRKLAEGRIGAAALGMSAWRDLQAQAEHPAGDVDLVAQPLFIKDYHLVISHQRYARSPQAALALWSAIAEQRERLAPTAADPSAPATPDTERTGSRRAD
jgi:polar amino acid transport system substrate-binding protein